MSLPPIPTCLPTPLAAYAEECCEIGPDIQAEFMRVARDLWYWAAQGAYAEDHYVRQKAALDRAWGAAMIRAKNELEAEQAGAKKASTPEWLVQAMAESDPAVDRERDLYAIATRRRAEVRDIIGAVHAKREMLVSLGAHLRKEMELDPVIRSRAT